MTKYREVGLMGGLIADFSGGGGEENGCRAMPVRNEWKLC